MMLNAIYRSKTPIYHFEKSLRFLTNRKATYAEINRITTKNCASPQKSAFWERGKIENSHSKILILTDARL